MSRAKPRSAVATELNDLILNDDISVDMRVKLLQLAHIPSRSAYQTILIAQEFEEYVLTGKATAPD